MLIKLVKYFCLFSLVSSQLVLAATQQVDLPIKKTVVVQKTSSKKMITIVDDTEDPPRSVSLIVFNKKVYDIAYQTFLANQNLHDAYIIAKAAVEQEPNDFFWRKRYAQIARWTDHPQQSLTQWLYLVEKKPDLESINESIGLAQDLYDYVTLSRLYKLQLKYKEKSNEAIKGYVESKEAVGAPIEAAQELKQLIIEDPKLAYYDQLIKLYKKTGEDQAALNAINELQVKYPIPIDIALIKAEILYARSNIKLAYKTLLPYVDKASSKDLEFWRVFGQLAWLSQAYDEARRAYLVLYNQKYEDQIVYIRLIALLPKTNPKKAYDVAMEGWKKYQLNYFLLSIMSLTAATGQWSALNQFLNTLPDSAIKYLETVAYYYSTKGQMYAASNQKDKAIAMYQLGMSRFPDSAVIKRDYLWFLIQNKYKLMLEKVLRKWSNQILDDENFIPVLSAAYIELNQPNKLVELYSRKTLSAMNTNELIALSGALNDLNQNKAAYEFRRLAWRNLVEKSESDDEVALLDTERGLIEFSSIGGDYLSGSDLSLIQKRLIELSTQNTYQALMTWALRYQQYEWVRYLWSRRHPNQKVPIWMQQSIALHQYDRYHLDKLLKENLENIPYRDRVLIAQRLGYRSMAQHLAHIGAIEHPQDTEIQQIFSTIQLQDSPYVLFEPFYRNNGAISGPGWMVRTRIILTPNVSILPWVDLWHTRVTDDETIFAPTSLDRMIGIEVREKVHKGEIRYIIGQRHALRDFLFGSVIFDYQVLRKLNVLSEFSYNKEASDSTALLVAGVKNEVKITLQWLLTSYNTLISVLGYQYFKSQDNVYLGSGESLDLVYTRQLFKSQPNWQIALFGTLQRYQLNGRLSPVAASIIPPNQTRDLTFYIPESFIRYGASIGFGQTYKNSYTQQWRPFGQFSIYRSDTSGFGNLIEVGLAGSVFGLDHLAFFGTRGTSLEAAAQVDSFIGLRYQLYF